MDPVYRDDIFLFWNGTLEQLKEFIEKLNNLHPTIKFEANYSLTSIDFLDTHIYKAINGKLYTTLHSQLTDNPISIINHTTQQMQSIA